MSDKQTMSRHLPILQGVLPITRARIPAEILAGITLAAIAVPEVMGYTKIAGTPLITGLYTMLIPTASVRFVRLLAAPGGGRRFGDGGDPCQRHGGNRSHRFGAIHGTGRLACVDGSGFLDSGAPHAPGISGRLPLAHCVDRIPDRGRCSGRAGGDRRYVGLEGWRPWRPGKVLERPSTARAGQPLRTDRGAKRFGGHRRLQEWSRRRFRELLSRRSAPWS